MKDVSLRGGTGDLLKQLERPLDFSQIGSHPVVLLPDLGKLDLLVEMPSCCSLTGR